MSKERTEFPKTLFVVEEPKYAYYFDYDLKHLVGKPDLASAVPDREGTTTVATYQLVQVETYKKVVTKTETVSKV